MASRTQLPSYSTTPITRVQIAQWASATNDFSPLHLDDPFAKEAGFGGVFVPAVFSLYIANQALVQLGAEVEINELVSTFSRIVWPGDSLTVKGYVTPAKKNSKQTQIELTVENQNHDVVMTGTALCTILKKAAKKKTKS